MHTRAEHFQTQGPPTQAKHSTPPPERKDKSQDRTRAAEDRTKDNIKNKTTRMRAHLTEQSYYVRATTVFI